MHVAWTSETAFETLMRQHGFLPQMAAVLSEVRQCYYLEEIHGPNVNRLQSHFGGSPVLPVSESWPRSAGGRHLDLIASICLSEVTQHIDNCPLPESGWLQFFADTLEEPAGATSLDQQGYSVSYLPETEGQLVSTPADASEFESSVVRVVPGISPPDHIFGSLDDVRGPEYVDLFIRPPSPVFRILGYPASLQNGMKAHAAEVGRKKSHGFSVDDWQLLFQLDSGGCSQFHWGANGSLYYWISVADLRIRRFDRTISFLQQT